MSEYLKKLYEIYNKSRKEEPCHSLKEDNFYLNEVFTFLLKKRPDREDYNKYQTKKSVKGPINFEKRLQIKKREFEYRQEYDQKEKNYEEFISKLHHDNFKPIKTDYIEPKFELGEIYMVNNCFAFLLTGIAGYKYVGYKVTEWVEFATNKDFVFKTGSDIFMAIIEKLYIPKKQIGSFICCIDEEFLNVLLDYEIRGIAFPPKYTGLTVSTSSIQYQFRNKELERIEKYLANFQLIQSLHPYPVVSMKSFQNILKRIIDSLEYPSDTHSYKTTVKGENFLLFFDKSKRVLNIQLTEDSLINSKIIEVTFFDNECLFLKESNNIEIKINMENIDLEYISMNLEFWEY